LSIGQSAVLLGKMQAHVDRMIESPGGAWDTVVNVGEVACALCTAASRHPAALALARELLGQLLGASQMSEEQKEHAARGFQHAKTTLDPLMKVKGLAEGLAGKREQELMAIRDAIVANTDATLEADVPKAAEHLLKVLDFCERVDTHGKVQVHANNAHLGLFLYYVWRRVARYGFDRTQSSESHQWTFYLFNGATYERGQFEQLESKAKRHMRSIVDTLSANVQLRTRVSNLEVKCDAENFVSRAIAEMQPLLKDVEQLGWCGLVSPNDFQLELDTGNYIGFKNGVYDILHDRFLPKGAVPLNVLVSMCTNYDYVGPDDPKFPENREQIEEFYRKLHAEDYENPNDERLAAMWLLSGSLLFRGNVCKKAFVFLGSEGDNGKSTFTELIQLTLGDYAVTGNRSSLSGTQEQMTLDPDLVANHKSLVCTFPEVQSIEGGVSSGFKFNCGKLKALTGNDEQSVRGLYRDKKGIVIAFKPILHSNYMPQVDSDDSAARNRLWVARFGSTFPADLVEPDVHRRRFPRIENLRDTMREWAPYHFLLMLEALRDFRRRNCVLPVGAQQIEGSLMHQEVVAQAPEGRLRSWVEANYMHVPLREKDTGTKLDVLYSAYMAASPPVHQKSLGKIKLAAMLSAVYPGIGPHRNGAGTVSGLYLLR
jgi:phage/plasmid-associated DNA primase